MEKAWVVAVDMGYGHQRPAFALQKIAQGGKTITANDYPGIPKLDHTIWQETRRVYEFVSRFKKIPVLGDLAFALLDKVQEIKPFYPKERPVERPGFQLKVIWQLMERKGWGRHLISKLNQNPIPLVSTFPVPGFMAEYWEYQGDIYLLVTDSDAARAWVPLFPKESRIRYLAPTPRVAQRLHSYGVPKERIFLTGFPLPEEFADGNGFLETKKDLRRRLARLDPHRKYVTRYSDVVRRYLGKVPAIVKESPAPLITFAVGGAGAQQVLGTRIMEGLASLLKEGKLRLLMVAATHKDAAVTFRKKAQELGLFKHQATVAFFKTKNEYFREFSSILRETDILWTKPSELSFYAALGIPLLLSPPIGSQEEQNQKWLLRVGAGISQLAPESAADWMEDFLNQGLFAEAAMQGFVEMERNGARNIAQLLKKAGEGKKK
ncbi:MAG: hypothetical protein Q8P12_01875 [bacterium]|nr:hypothetical protein [bacterium]